MESKLNTIKLLELEKGKLEYKIYYLQAYTYKFNGFNEKFNEEKNDDFDYFVIRNRCNIDIDKMLAYVEEAKKFISYLYFDHNYS
jgi:hypothetical protein